MHAEGLRKALDFLHSLVPCTFLVREALEQGRSYQHSVQICKEIDDPLWEWRGGPPYALWLLQYLRLRGCFVKKGVFTVKGVGLDGPQVAPAACHPDWRGHRLAHARAVHSEGEGATQGASTAGRVQACGPGGDKAALSCLSMGACVLGWGRGDPRLLALLPPPQDVPGWTLGQRRSRTGKVRVGRCA